MVYAFYGQYFILLKQMDDDEEFDDIELDAIALTAIAGGRNDGKRLAC